MKRWFFAVSLIIIGAGAVMVTSYTLPSPGPTAEERAAYVSESRTVEADLVQGDFIRLAMTQGSDWRNGYFEIDDLLYPGFAILWVGVNITDPQGKNITFLTTWTPMDLNVETPPLTYLDKNVTTNLNSYDGGIDPYADGSNYRPPSNSFFEVGGKVKLTGRYTFQVWGIIPSRNDPPASLDVRKHQIVTTHPLTYMLPLGIAVVAAGTALAAYSILSKSKTRLKKTRVGNKRKIS